MNKQSNTQQNDIGLWLALGAGIGSALMAAGLGAWGVALGVGGGLMVWAIRTHLSQRSQM